MSADDASSTLDCGRTIDELSSYVEAGRTPPDPHIESCPDCLNTLEALERVGQLSRDLVADDAERMPRPPESWFEGILSVKWLRRIKVVDQFYMTYNDYGHLRQDADDAALSYQWGPKSVITFPSGGQQMTGTGFYEIRGLAWSGGGKVTRVEVSTDGGRSWRDAEIRGTPQRMAHTLFTMNWNWDGSEAVLMSRCTDELGSVQPTRAQAAAFFNKPVAGFNIPGLDNTVMPWHIASDGSVTNGLANG